jgi:hypothetical protein
MLNQVSWTTYFEILILLAAVYYLFVLFRYYSDDVRQLTQKSRSQTSARQIPDALRYDQAEQIIYPAAGTEQEQHRVIFEQDNEATDLSRQLKQCIQTASDKPFAPAVFIPQLKKLFRDNPQLQHSPHRDAINELVVQECEKTGTALLTEDEVDQWWSD